MDDGDDTRISGRFDRIGKRKERVGRQHRSGGAIAGPRLTWAWADILNGMMAIPNLVALLALAGGLAKLVRSQDRAAAEAP